MQIDYNIELSYGEGELKVGDHVRIPPSFPEFPIGCDCRIVDIDVDEHGTPAYWHLDPFFEERKTADSDDEVIPYVVWPFEQEGLTRTEDVDIPGEEEVARFVREGMERCGLPSADVTVTRQ